MPPSETIHYVDHSDILPGRLEDAKAAMRELAAFVETVEPQLLAYHFYVDRAGSTMSLVAVHPDAASLELHLELGGPRFRAFVPLIRMRSIDVYGDPGPSVMDRLRAKAALLGDGTVTAHTRVAGFTR
ncbi:hypothetical protein [Streptomyces lavendulae]|uniref:hypothetical protein n=1 Tax=Streptomyces lavendulae TaxID=1914 RepID=UPI0024A1C5F9|nr:hypothetical protein [Streptomyces lavendulae]GLX21972.1 hypothetical protein Slala01_56160 [Streptomyces lavendulae subsp. lavendulae]GLX29680.1 hypothetical protein Slala02_55000 [Streptomyces lavendulae subsp. lavendulae]